MSQTSRDHKLNGLQPDNLLSFLALLGTMRAIECARPEWRVRARWSVEDPPLHPVLHTTEPVTSDDVCGAVAAGCRVLLSAVAPVLAARRAIKLNANEAREQQLIAVSDDVSNVDKRFVADLLIAIGSDGGRQGGEQSLSPLVAQGGGRLKILPNMRALAMAEVASRRLGAGTEPNTAIDVVRRALMQPWQRKDDLSGLRWDAEEGRQHAYQAIAPTNDALLGVELGAQRLALVGLSCFPALPSAMEGQLRTPVPGCETVRVGAEGGVFSVGWPLWPHAMTLAAIRALLAMGSARRRDYSPALGGAVEMRTSRISLGKYVAFTRAAAIQLEMLRQGSSLSRCVRPGHGSGRPRPCTHGRDVRAC